MSISLTYGDSIHWSSQTENQLSLVLLVFDAPHFEIRQHNSHFTLVSELREQYQKILCVCSNINFYIESCDLNYDS